MGVYNLSKKAEIDVAEMFEYGIHKFGLDQAQYYFFGMHDVFSVLADNPNLGRDASEFIAELRRFTYKVHTIFYFHSVRGIFIVRVLSQRMDIEQPLSES